MEMIIHNLKHGVMITVFVFIMMIFIDYIEVLTEGRMSSLIKGGRFRQYIMTSFLGSTPGCLGAFMNVSFYIHGLISFGAIAGGMIATSGDEAFVMLAMFPEKALLLFGILFLVGIISAYIIDWAAPLLKVKACEDCGHPFNYRNNVRERACPVFCSPFEFHCAGRPRHAPIALFFYQGLHADQSFQFYYRRRYRAYILFRRILTIPLFSTNNKNI